MPKLFGLAKWIQRRITTCSTISRIGRRGCWKQIRNLQSLATTQCRKTETRKSMLLIETGLVLASLVVALVYPSLGSRRFEKLERIFFHFSRHRTLSVIFAG